MSEFIEAYSDLNWDWVYFCDQCITWHRHNIDSLTFTTSSVQASALSVCPNRRSVIYDPEYFLQKMGFIGHKKKWSKDEKSCIPTPVWLSSSMVYFIQCNGVRGYIKIGKSSSKSFWSRFYNIQVSNPYKVEFLGAMSEDIENEQEVHARFSIDRTRGEWFECSDRLIDFIYDKARWWK